MIKPSATISVEWEYEDHSITLTPRNWAKVKSGKGLKIRGKGYIYDAEFFWDYWQFGGGLDASLDVYYGDDGRHGFTRNLSDA
jgi:hypothetical protein